MDIKEARQAIAEWMTDEYGYDDPAEVSLGKDAQIGIAYCEFEDGAFVTEQWYADLKRKRIYCELNNIRIGKLCYHFDSLEELVESLDFNWLISESDSYIYEHINEFKEA